MAERLAEFGFDPRLIKDEKQLIQALNLIKAAEDKIFAQRFGDMLRPRKSAKVFSIKDKKKYQTLKEISWVVKRSKQKKR